jgi:hypothetical protein
LADEEGECEVASNSRPNIMVLTGKVGIKLEYDVKKEKKRLRTTLASAYSVVSMSSPWTSMDKAYWHAYPIIHAWAISRQRRGHSFVIIYFKIHNLL